MFRGLGDGPQYAGMGTTVGLERLLAAGRRLLALLTWFAVIAMAAGAYAYWQLSNSASMAATLFLAFILLGPPLVLLHFVLVLRLTGLRFTAFTPRAWLRYLLTVRWLAAGTLLNPWYWALLLLALIASIAIVPFAFAVAIL